GGPADRAGLRPGDMLLTVAEQPVRDAQGLQRLLFEDAVDARLPITVLRNGAKVDVFAVPRELVAD
ncbi:MAG: PDZ domain-containing protein, partial [Actinomycetota bacterium]|nr:PDZ domain-containing protein [Actinomycetota bacterium]